MAIVGKGLGFSVLHSQQGIIYLNRKAKEYRLKCGSPIAQCLQVVDFQFQVKEVSVIHFTFELLQTPSIRLIPSLHHHPLPRPLSFCFRRICFPVLSVGLPAFQTGALGISEASHFVPKGSRNQISLLTMLNSSYQLYPWVSGLQMMAPHCTCCLGHRSCVAFLSDELIPLKE